MLPVGNMVPAACGAAPRWRLPRFDCRPPRTSPDLGLRPVLAGPVGCRAVKPRRSGGASGSVGIGVLAAPGLRRNIGERLGERPLMAREVLGGVLPLAEHHVGRLHQDLRAVLACPQILMEPSDMMYGERQYTAEDLAGHQWTFTETLADVAPETWGGEYTNPD